MLANTGTDQGTADVNRGASISGSQTVPQRKGGMPPTQFLRPWNVEQLHGGGGGPSTSGGVQVQQQDSDGDMFMQDHRFPLHKQKWLIEWRHEPNGGAMFGRINAAIMEEIPEPANYQAINGPNAEEWRHAMDEEITAQLTNGVFVDCTIILNLL
ncbi:hypothetical protein Vafri_15170 [Volvox africanus]|nr:hypothetical protein Vafri_15170 [Volvox africanus]